MLPCPTRIFFVGGSHFQGMLCRSSLSENIMRVSDFKNVLCNACSHLACRCCQHTDVLADLKNRPDIRSRGPGSGIIPDHRCVRAFVTRFTWILNPLLPLAERSAGIPGPLILFVKRGKSLDTYISSLSLDI